MTLQNTALVTLNPCQAAGYRSQIGPTTNQAAKGPKPQPTDVSRSPRAPYKGNPRGAGPMKQAKKVFKLDFEKFFLNFWAAKFKN